MREWIAVIVLASAARGQDPLAGLSDEFEVAATLASWAIHHQAEGWPSQIVALDIDVTSPGQLAIEPEVSSWFEDYRGIFIYKEVEGDFSARTRVLSTGRSGPLPTSNFSLAGLMVRAPRDVTAASWTPRGENWLFLNSGANGGQAVLETKTTRDSVSVLRLIPSQAGWVELCIERKGPRFILQRRFEGGRWETMEVFTRPDLPVRLQVGLDAYTDWDSVPALTPYAFNSTVVSSPPGRRDLLARFDHFRLRRPTFRRGDVNGDGDRDISDPLAVLLHLFQGLDLPCPASADHDDSGLLEVTDAVRALVHLFQDGPEPEEPFLECALDPTPDALPCGDFPPCQG